jgi:cytochrome c peroxidase
MNQPLAGVGFDTPTLIGSWAAKSYMHNGQKASVLDVIAGGHGNASGLPTVDQQALAAYVRSLDTASEVSTRLRSNHSGL